MQAGSDSRPIRRCDNSGRMTRSIFCVASRAGCRPGRPDGEGATVREKCVGRNYGTTAALWGLHGAGGVASMLSASTGASSMASREQTGQDPGV